MTILAQVSFDYSFLGPTFTILGIVLGAIVLAVCLLCMGVLLREPSPRVSRFCAQLSRIISILFALAFIAADCDVLISGPSYLRQAAPMIGWPVVGLVVAILNTILLHFTASHTNEPEA